jgi:hypothetical protein
MYDYAPLQKKLMPSLKEVLDAMKKADARDEKSRDTRPLMACLMRMVEAHPRLGGYIKKRRTAITSFDWAIRPRKGGPGNEAGALERTIRLRPVIEAVLARIFERDLYGHFALQLVWEATADAGQVRPRIAYDPDPDEVERPSRRREQLQFLTWEATGTGGSSKAFNRSPVPVSDPAWLAVVDDSHWAGGTLRSLLIRAVLLNEGLKDWAGYTKRLKGILSAKFTGDVPEEGDSERATAEGALKVAGTDGYALHSDNVEFQMWKIVEAAAGQSHKEFKQELEADMAIAVLGQANTSELPKGGGSRAAVQVLSLVSRDIHHADIRCAEQLIADELLVYDERMNADPAAVESAYEFVVLVAQDEDFEANARTLVDARVILEGTPFGVLASELYGRLGLTVPTGTPEVITWPSPGGAGGTLPPIPET